MLASNPAVISLGIVLPCVDLTANRTFRHTSDVTSHMYAHQLQLQVHTLWQRNCHSTKVKLFHAHSNMSMQLEISQMFSKYFSIIFDSKKLRCRRTSDFMTCRGNCCYAKGRALAQSTEQLSELVPSVSSGPTRLKIGLT
jgi:hypothetical protein